MSYAALTPLQKNSLPAKTTSLLAAGGSSVDVDDQSVFYRGGVLITKGWVLGPDNSTISYTEEIEVLATAGTSGPGTVTISARAVKADGTNGAAREWAIGTTIKNTYTTSVHDQVIDNFKAAVGSWGDSTITPTWSEGTPDITSTIARHVRNGNVTTFAITINISDGHDAVLDSIPLPVAATQIAGHQVPLSAFKLYSDGVDDVVSDPYAYVDYNEATPIIKLRAGGSFPDGNSAVLNISGSYEVPT